MFRHNFVTYGGRIVTQILMEIIYFPFWWYSVGFGRLVKGAFKFWRGQEQSLGLSVWAKNIFVPMYGQYDIAGRVISFFIRLVQIIFRSVAMLFWLLILVALLVAWLVLPLSILLAIIFQISQ